MLVSARLDGSTSQTGTFYELDAIAAAVIGGVSLRGGIGTIPGVIGGAILLSMIDNGMNLVATSTFAQLIVKGGILLGCGPGCIRQPPDLGRDSPTRLERRDAEHGWASRRSNAESEQLGPMGSGR